MAYMEQSTGTAETIQFRGTGSEYFGIWIVNLLLTILTLGIYSAWAKVRRLRYFYGNTWLAGTAFEYHGQPKQILKGRLIAFGLLVLYQLITDIWPLAIFVLGPLLFLAVPWLVVRARLFTSRMTSYRNLRFDFKGTYGEAAVIFMLLPIGIVLTLGLLLPYWLYRRDLFLVSRTAYGKTPWRLLLGPGTFYKIALMTLVYALPFLCVMVLGAWMVGFGAFTGRAPAQPGSGPGFFVLFLGYLGLLAVPQAYFWVKKQNAVLGNAHLSEHRLLSNMQVGRYLFIVATNLVLIVITLGFYTPFAQVRLAKYRLEALTLQVHGTLDEFVAAEARTTTATGEEVSDFFDVDFGF
jgi:uncharacterized membrane protein YjgN (DUF898 family)